MESLRLSERVWLVFKRWFEVSTKLQNSFVNQILSPLASNSFFLLEFSNAVGFFALVTQLHTILDLINPTPLISQNWHNIPTARELKAKDFWYFGDQVALKRCWLQTPLSFASNTYNAFPLKASNLIKYTSGPDNVRLNYLVRCNCECNLQ